MGLLIAASIFLIIVIGGLSSLAISSFNSGRKSGREKEAQNERDRANAETHLTQQMLSAQANAPKTAEELQNRLKGNSF
ncbi:hypothetical protein FAI41_04790 [Acetobacteraceae bacterium]|nr:hypothetical protein FAI41_04790 [Acetobacteraceae bacterium]